MNWLLPADLMARSGRVIGGVDEQPMSSDGLLGTLIASRPALLRYLALRGASVDEAEDILQQVSLRLSAETIGPVAEPRAYLYRMANNHFLGLRRTATRQMQREVDWVDAHGAENRELDESPSAEVRLIAREQLAILQAVLDKLPERTRMIFRRFRIEGDPQRQIAADLGISLSAVEKHLTRAYEAISAARLRVDGVSIEPRCLSDERGRNDN